MSWNYRLAKKKHVADVLGGEDYEEDCFGIVETYYNDDGEICFTSKEFQEPYGETFEGLKWCFEKMQEAFKLPVLDLDNIEYADH